MKLKTIFILFAIVFIFTGCSANNHQIISLSVDDALIKEVEAKHSFDDPFIALDPYENAPLSALVIFTTPKETGVEIKVLGHHKEYHINNYFSKAKNHVLPIFGLYAGEENTVILTLDDGTTKEIKINTEDIEAPLKKVNIVKAESDQMMEGLTFISLGMKSSDGIVAAAYDNNGDIRWALKADSPAWDIYRLNNGNVLASSPESHSDPYYSMGIREIDLMGKTYAKYSVPGGYHHGAQELPNGNFLVAAQEEKGDTAEDVAYEIDKDTKEVVKSFDLKDILPMDDGSSLSYTSHDWFHNNALWFDEKNNSLIFSGRNADAVVAVDYHSGELKWILGDPEGWTKVDKKYFFNPVGDDFQWQYAQHGAMITPEGYVFIFDNGPFRAKKTNQENKLSGDENYSRAVLYKIDEDNMRIEQIWQYGKERGSDWYSYYLGDVDYLSENHYLINSGGQLYDTVNQSHEVGLDELLAPETKRSTSIVEIKNNDLIFELKTNFNVYATERMSLYTEKDDFKLYEEGIE